MPTLQLIYTSCRRGESGSSGFQFRTSTPGVSVEERREIESFIGYTAPLAKVGDAELTTEEIQATYPRMLRCQRLKSGRWMLSLTCYIGKDYSQRGGNFFAHTLVTAERPPNWPIDYYDWEGWQTLLRPEDDTLEQPPPLDPLPDLSTVAPSASFTLDSLREFMRERGDRPEVLEAMARVLASGQTVRKIVVRADFLDGVFWLAALQKLFPPSTMGAVTLSTYQYDETRLADLNLTVERGRFTFDETNRERRFFMFDMLTDVHSKPLPRADDYAARAVRWLMDPAGTLGEFHRFAESFDLPAPASRLREAARLFDASRGEGAPLRGDELAAVLDFAHGAVLDEGRAGVLDTVIGLTRHIRTTNEPKDRLQVLQYFANTAAGTRQRDDRELAWRTWLDLFVDCVKRPQLTYDLVNKGREIIESTLRAWAGEFAEWYLSPEVQGEVRDAAGGNDPVAWSRALAQAAARLRTLHRAPLHDQPAAMEWMLKIFQGLEATDAARGLLAEVGANASEAAATALHFLSNYHQWRPEKSDAGQFVAEFGQRIAYLLASAPLTEARRARGILDVPAGFPVLQHEWAAVCAGPGDPLEALRRHRAVLEQTAPGFAREGYGGMVLTLDRRLGRQPALRLKAAQEHRRELATLPQEVQRNWIAALNDGMTFRQEGGFDRGSIDDLFALARRHGVQCSPDRLALWRCFAAADDPEEAGILPSDTSVQGVAHGAAALDPSERRVFLKRFLVSALRKVRSPAQHDELVRLFATPLARDAFDAYREALESQPLTAAHLAAIVPFWVAPAHAPPRPIPDDDLRSVREKLAERIGEIERGERDALLKNLRAVLAGNPGALKELEHLVAAASKGRSFLSRILQRS